MRLAQIARKVGMTPSDIQKFLEKEFEVKIGKEPNYKLNEEQLSAVLETYPEIEDKEVFTRKEPNNTLSEVMNNEQESSKEELDNTESEEIPKEEQVEDDTQTKEIIQTNEIPEINDQNADKSNEIKEEIKEEEEFIEVEVDPDAELIQAPKIKLDGLKILGKIELPEDKKIEETPEKTDEEIAAEEAAEIAHLDAAMQSQAQDIKNKKDNETAVSSESEYKDAKGIYHFSHTQKENRAKALIEIEIKRKAKAEKEKKKRHYEKLMADKATTKKTTQNQEKNAPSKKISQPKKKKKVEEKPKSLWGKFLKWLND